MSSECYRDRDPINQVYQIDFWLTSSVTVSQSCLNFARWYTVEERCHAALPRLADSSEPADPYRDRSSSKWREILSIIWACLANRMVQNTDDI